MITSTRAYLTALGTTSHVMSLCSGLAVGASASTAAGHVGPAALLLHGQVAHAERDECVFVPAVAAVLLSSTSRVGTTSVRVRC